MSALQHIEFKNLITQRCVNYFRKLWFVSKMHLICKKRTVFTSIWFYSPVCNRVCCCTWESCLNLRSQYEHLYGFSPVWTRMCCTNWWLLEKLFMHCWHWCGLLSAPILPGAPRPTRGICCICCIALLCMKSWSPQHAHMRTNVRRRVSYGARTWKYAKKKTQTHLQVNSFINFPKFVLCSRIYLR